MSAKERRLDYFVFCRGWLVLVNDQFTYKQDRFGTRLGSAMLLPERSPSGFWILRNCKVCSSHGEAFVTGVLGTGRWGFVFLFPRMTEVDGDVLTRSKLSRDDIGIMVVKVCLSQDVINCRTQSNSK